MSQPDNDRSPPDSIRRILSALEERNRDSAERIRGLMFTFEDLQRVDGGGLQALLRSVEKDKLALARKTAEELIVTSEAEAKRRVVLAESEGRSKAVVGEGESRRLSLEGEAEAQVQQRKIASFGDPRLYALAKVAEQLSASKQPLVPERLLITGGGDGPGGQSLVGTLLGLMVADKSGFDLDGPRKAA